jgi:hypothetical protein
MVYVKWAPIVSGLIATRIINSYKALRAYVTCVASAIETIEEGELKIFNALAAPGDNITVDVVWSTNKPSRSKTWWRCEEAGIVDWQPETNSSEYTKYHSARMNGLPIDALISIKILCEIDTPYEYAEEIIDVEQNTTNYIEPTDVDGLSSAYAGMVLHTPTCTPNNKRALPLVTEIEFYPTIDVDGMSPTYVNNEIIDLDTNLYVFDSALVTTVDEAELVPE